MNPDVPTLWERVDERVLGWVASLPPSLDVDLIRCEEREPEPFEHIPEIDSRTVSESLRRLISYGLVDGRPSESMQSTTWSRLRLTAHGLIVRGEWPDLDRVASAASIHRLLRAVAEHAPEEERSALVRAAGVVARTADEVLRGTAADVAGTIGREAAGA